MGFFRKLNLFLLAFIYVIIFLVVSLDRVYLSDSTTIDTLINNQTIAIIEDTQSESSQPPSSASETLWQSRPAVASDDVKRLRKELLINSDAMSYLQKVHKQQIEQFEDTLARKNKEIANLNKIKNHMSQCVDEMLSAEKQQPQLTN